ncbi:hypothetical protein T484DRAFT_1817544 [Baffinella frigidus]|nr:hypothetical protein T484DRAFT_1817544 [Cryptophyta sp. CCMP2293]
MVLEGGTDVINKSAGTPAFTSPEACVEGDYSGKAADACVEGDYSGKSVDVWAAGACVEGDYSGKAADVWAAGVTLYIFAHGKISA